MCTAITYKTQDLYFGRTLDNYFSYDEEVTITPRYFPFRFRHAVCQEKHYAMIGTAYITNNYPLYYEAVNEKGLAIAGLNFVDNAVYQELQPNKDNIAPFEFIPWILSQCSSIKDACLLLNKINLVNTPFNEKLPLAQLHWLMADNNTAITVEAVAEGIKIYPNPIGVLTNNPPFDKQLFQLNNYMNLSPQNPKNLFSERLNLETYSHGMGALGLPGDLSSQSRFVRAAFIKMNSVTKNTENESVNQFFHILGGVEQQRGCCKIKDDTYEITSYTSCYNINQGILYYTTYGNHQITRVNMAKENLDGSQLIHYPLSQEEQIQEGN